MWNWTENKIEVNLKMNWIRHAKTEANQKRCYLGKTEEPLSEEGVRQIQQMTALNTDYIVSSPMIRCIETVKLLYKREPDFTIPEWSEINFGVFEGKTYEQLKDNAAYQEWIQTRGESKIPEGESRKEFIQRCLVGMDRFLLHLKQKDMLNKKATVTAVVHGGTIMALFDALSEGDYYDFQVKNGQGYECILTNENHCLQFINRKELLL